MASTPARPGVLVEFFVSSFRLTAVSQPQKKKTPRVKPTAMELKPPSRSTVRGLNQPMWKPVEPAGWLTATLMMPQRENPITTTYSMMTRIHWKFVVQRMP